MAEEEGVTHTKTGNFSEWYNEVVLKGGLADFSSAKGFMFIKPTGYAIWERIQHIFNEKIQKTGHENAFCPTVMPERLLKREKEHLEGFAPEVFYVTHAGNSKLDERLVLKPTGETVIYEAYSKWVRSWRDLPLKYNYWNSSFRAEIKMTKLFLRTSEFLWQEGHTVHATEKEAAEEVLLILDDYRSLMEEQLAIPVLTGKKSEKEKFAGALYTTTLEAMMPDGKALQMGTSHHLGQNFSKPFNIKFLDKHQKRQLAWQTSWGISTRMIGALVMVHGDDKGLVLPPHIAPIQAVVVPIYKDKTRALVEREAKKIRSRLNVRSTVDLREQTPGWKFHDWELRGVPLRIEVGPRDLEKKQVILVRRDTGAKQPVKLTLLDTAIKKLLEDIQKSLFAKATAFLKAHTHSVKTFKEFQSVLEKKRGFLLAGWCQSRKCEEKVKDKTTADIRLIPFDRTKAPCIVCKKAGMQVYFAKAY